MSDFIIHSRDFPEGVLGVLGMLNDAREFAKVRVLNESEPDIRYDGRGYSLNMTRASEGATAFTINDQLEGRKPIMRGPDTVNQTILYRGFSTLFDLFSSRTPGYASLACEHFLPALCNTQLKLTENHYLDNVTASRVTMGDGDFTEGIRHGLISCLLGGGGECGFNNVMMAEAGARLATGRRVFAKLEDRPEVLTAEPLQGPLAEEGWRVANIISPMQRVGEIGTASKMRELVKLPAGYKVIYKTGTLVEGIKGRDSEALMFVVGKWENGGFVVGKSLAGFLYMERSKDTDKGKSDGVMKKFEFAAPIVSALLKYLGEPARRS